MRLCLASARPNRLARVCPAAVLSYFLITSENGHRTRTASPKSLPHGLPMGTLEGIQCPIARTAMLIGDRWTPLIVRDLAPGCRRFSELQRSLAGISPKTLSDRLRRLEEAGLISRTCFAEMPPRVEYRLTDKGHALLPILESMREFGDLWLADTHSPN